MTVELLGYTPDASYICSQAAAVCVGSEPSLKGLRKAISSGHESIIEHASFTFRAERVSRVFLAQLTRHRLASYSVESERYVDSSDKAFILPRSLTGLESSLAYEVADHLADARELYEALVAQGVPREDARYILPQAVETSIIFTMNARELRHFFSLRCCNRAQREIRDVADEMYRLVNEAVPELFEDCGPGCMTTGCREARPCGHLRTRNGILDLE